MNKLSQKIVAIATILSVAVMLVPVSSAQALTTADLQAQIAALQAQLAQLTGQLSGLQGSSTGLPAACVGITFNRNLTRNSVGNDVKCLQSLLNQLNVNVADTGAGSPGNETTFFGGATRAAVIRFQELYKADCLTPIGLTLGTGFVGTLTRGKLNGLLTGLVTPGTPGTPGTPITGNGLTVYLASDNPAAATIVADTVSANGAQSMVPFLKVVLTNGDSSAVKVTRLEFVRGGISADSDISQSYLYDGDTMVAEYSSFNNTVLTFNASAGIVTIPAGSSKTLTLKCDIANGTGSGKTIRFSVNSASAVASDSSSIKGTYPLVGNFMSTATAADLGKLTVATTTGPVATIDPQDGAEVMNFSMAASAQNLEVRYLKFTNIGSTDANDLKNFKLYDGGTQIGSTVASMESDKTVVFNLTGNPLVINKGVTKNMHLRADIASGTSKTFEMTVQEMADIVVFDKQYGVYLKPNQSDSWSILYAYYVGSVNYTTINTGKMTLSRASDSPSGNIALDATNVTIAKFNMKATGEDAKVTAMVIRVYGGVDVTGLYQGYISLDGSQQGTATTGLGSAATDVAGANTTFTFGNTFIVPADGKDHVLEVKADIKKAAGTSYSGTETMTVKVQSVTATGRTSSQTVSVASATGYNLTIAAGTLVVSKNQSQGSWTATYPTGITGQVEALVGSFIVSAGSSEGADITAVRLQYTTTTINSQMQNLKVYKGTLASGTQIGNTQSTVSKSTDYTFYPSPYVSLAKNEQFVMNVYADLLTSAPTNTQGYITVTEVDGTGKVTNTSINATPDILGQTIWLVNSGTMGVNIDSASTPNPTNVVMGDAGVVLGKWKFSASTSAEAINVTNIIATSTLSATGVTSTLANVKLYDGATQVGSALSGLDVDGEVSFDLSANPWVIPARSEKILTIKADVAEYPNSISNSSTTMRIRSVTYKGAASGEETIDTAVRIANLANIYNTKPVVTFVPFTGSDASLQSGQRSLIEFKVKAADHAALDIYRFNFRFTLYDGATTTNLYIDDITLYDKSDLSTALNNAVSSSTAAPANTWTTSTIAASTIGYGGILDKGDGSYNNSQAVDVGVLKHSGSVSDGIIMDSIAAGEEITYVLKGTIAGTGVAADGDFISVELNDWLNITTGTSTAVVWGDQYTTSISSQYVKTLPAGPTVLD